MSVRPPTPRKWEGRARDYWQAGWLDGYHGREPDPFPAHLGTTREQAYYEGHEAGVTALTNQQSICRQARDAALGQPQS